MHAHPVARAYAGALLELARERGRLDDIGAQLAGVARLVHEEKDIRVFLETPTLEPHSKKQVLGSALHGDVDVVVVDFLCLLIDKGRIPALGDIADAYRALADEAAGRRRVQATSALPLPEDLRVRLADLLRQQEQCDCILETDVRPDLLGGLVLTIEDRIYDGSLRGQLQRLRKEMMRSSGYED